MDAALLEAERSGVDAVIKKIQEQFTKAKLTFTKDDVTKMSGIIGDGIQSRQDVLTPTALTGEVEYKFTYKETTTSEEVSIRRREITDLLGEVASIRDE